MKAAAAACQFAEDLVIASYFVVHVALALFSLATATATPPPPPNDEGTPSRQSEVALRVAFEVLCTAEIVLDKMREADSQIPSAQFTAQWLELLAAVRGAQAVLNVQDEHAECHSLKESGDNARLLLSTLMGATGKSEPPPSDTRSPAEHISLGHICYLQGAHAKAVRHYEAATWLGALPSLLLNLEQGNISRALEIANATTSEGPVVAMMALFMALYFNGAVLLSYSAPYSDKLRGVLGSLPRDRIP
jgi:hypothetical protein